MPDSTSRRRRSTARVLATAALLAGAGTGAVPALPAHAMSVPPDTITQVGTAPNYFYTHDYDPKAPWNTEHVSAFADPVNHRLFEGSTHLICPALVEMDIDTFQVLATSARGGSKCSQVTDPMANLPSQSELPPLTVDPVDRLIFAATVSDVIVVDENTLGLLAHWPLPTDPTAPAPYAAPVSVSWTATGDQVLVLSNDYGNAPVQDPTPPGMHLTAFGVAQSLRQKQGAVLWNRSLQGCATSFRVSYFSPDAAWRASHENAVYVPCNVAGGDNQQGVDRLGLTTHGCAGPATECPDGSETVAVAPGGANGFLFDPAGDRALLPVQSGGISASVYSGHQAVIAGRTSIGTSADINETAVGLDTTTGRMYAMSGHAGLSVIDGRRTPVPQGTIFRQYADAVPGNEFPILPPDGTWPYTRVLVNHVIGFDPTKPGSGAQPDFTVYADTLPVTQDPPAGQIDENTTTGPVPSGATTTTAYGGDARGYGLHMDYVGGYGGALADVSSGDLGNGLPFARTTDLLAATVDHLSVDNQGADGLAGALADGTGGTAYDLGQCTGAQTAAACAPPPCTSGSCPAPPSPPPLPGSPPPTNQGWPFPEATCFRPGTADQESSTVRGVEVTPPGSAPTTVPGSDSSGAAVATVQCAATDGSAAGAAHAGAVQAGGAGLPAVSVAAADVSTARVGSASGGLVTGEVTSSAQGVHVDLGGGETLDIASIVQSATASAGGRAGTATTRRSVTLSGVRVAGTDLCSGPCSPQQVADAVNARFPAQMRVLLPAADDRYDHDVDASGAGKGSPGGYIAAVQATQDEQYGDEQFNAMSAEEASYLPALRIVVYGVGDGNPTISREVVDLAGVDVDAHLGIQVVPLFTAPVSQPLDVGRAAEEAGVPAPGALPTVRTAPVPHVIDAPPAPPVATSPGGHAGIVEAVYHGLDWLRRSPAQAVQMAAFLALLGLPPALMRRRWGWGTNRRGDTR